MELNEIVKLIQEGHTELYAELWERVRRFVKMKAHDHLRESFGFDGCRGHGGVEPDDLIQAGFIAVTNAAKTHDPEKGSFLTWLSFHLQTAFNEAMGLRKRTQDPLDYCCSVDREGWILNAIPGSNDIAEVEERIYNDQLKKALQKALNEIPEREAEILRKTYFEDKTLKRSGEEIGVSCERARMIRSAGLKSMRMNKSLNEFLTDQMNYYHGVGITAFNTTQTSPTEQLALRRMRLEKKYARLFLRINQGSIKGQGSGIARYTRRADERRSDSSAQPARSHPGDDGFQCCDSERQADCFTISKAGAEISHDPDSIPLPGRGQGGPPCFFPEKGARATEEWA